MHGRGVGRGRREAKIEPWRPPYAHHAAARGARRGRACCRHSKARMNAVPDLTCLACVSGLAMLASIHIIVKGGGAEGKRREGTDIRLGLHRPRHCLTSAGNCRTYPRVECEPCKLLEMI
jgi:hypothetical protein